MTDAWCEAGWEWGQAITHEEYVKALNGEWNVRLTPTKYVPHAWFGDVARFGKRRRTADSHILCTRRCVYGFRLLH